MRNPLVSFIVPAYNAENYLEDSLQSIINQTYKNWEAIIIDDGSKDKTYRKILTFNESRFKVYKNDKNTGLGNVRNQGLSLANGEWIAWLDSDDIAHIERLNLQLKFISRYPEINILGSWVQLFGNESSVLRYNLSDSIIRNLFLFEDPLATSSLLMKKDLFINNNLYFNDDFAPAEDYDLWERLLPYSKIANIQKILCFYRVHSSNSSSLKKDNQILSIKKIQERQLVKINIKENQIPWDIHLDLGVFFKIPTNKKKLLSTKKWIIKLLENKKDNKDFNKIIQDKWFQFCYFIDISPALKYKIWKSIVFNKYNFIYYFKFLILYVKSILINIYYVKK